MCTAPGYSRCSSGSHCKKTLLPEKCLLDGVCPRCSPPAPPMKPRILPSAIPLALVTAAFVLIAVGSI